MTRLATVVFWLVLFTGAGLSYGLMKWMTTDPAPPSDQVCYEPYGPPVIAEYFLRGSIVMVNFIDKDDMPDGYEAYAEYTPDFDNNFSWCLITATLPEQVLGDPAMDALGHELLHCISGAYHP